MPGVVFSRRGNGCCRACLPASYSGGVCVRVWVLRVACCVCFLSMARFMEEPRCCCDTISSIAWYAAEGQPVRQNIAKGQAKQSQRTSAAVRNLYVFFPVFFPSLFAWFLVADRGNSLSFVLHGGDNTETNRNASHLRLGGTNPWFLLFFNSRKMSSIIIVSFLVSIGYGLRARLESCTMRET